MLGFIFTSMHMLIVVDKVMIILKRENYVVYDNRSLCCFIMFMWITPYVWVI